jgi:hypothetical protein
MVTKNVTVCEGVRWAVRLRVYRPSRAPYASEARSERGGGTANVGGYPLQLYNTVQQPALERPLGTAGPAPPVPFGVSAEADVTRNTPIMTRTEHRYST